MRTIRPAATALGVAAIVGTLFAGCAAGNPTAASPPPDAAPELARLVDLAADRLATADEVAAAKWATGGAIADPTRESAVLDVATTGGSARGLDARDTASVFRDQIEANKAVQYGLFAGWSADPGHAPSTAPHLAGVRPVLDQLTPRLLDALRDATASRTGAGCAAELDRALERAGRERHLDQLHRLGLRRAVHSICR